MAEWIASSFVMAVLVYAHASYWQGRHGPMRSFFFNKVRSPMRCAFYVLISGGLGVVEYLFLCLMAGRPSMSAQKQDEFATSLRADAPQNRESTKDYWDQRFADGINTDQ